MKYWLYAQGNISGPYSVEELAALPSFSPMSLVCAEGATGTKPEDWKSACEIKEIAELVKVGVLSDNSWHYSEEDVWSNFSMDSEQNIDLPNSYSNLLDTIDNILNTYKSEKEEKEKTAVKKDEFDIVDKFDIRIAKIQEELEAARWEKNVLLERLRLKEEEEKKDKQRIEELERKLANILKKLESEEKVVYVEKDNEEKEKKEVVEKIEKIKQINEKIAEEKKETFEKKEIKEEKKEEVKDTKQEAQIEQVEVKKLSSLKRISDIAHEKIIERKEEKKEDFTIGIGQLKSFGYAKPKKLFEEDKKEGEEEKIKREEKKEELKPLPNQEAGIVYDFTVVTPKIEVKDIEKVNFKIEPKIESPEKQAKSLTSQPIKTAETKIEPTIPEMSPQIGGRFVVPPQQKIEVPAGPPKEVPKGVSPAEFVVSHNFEMPQTVSSVQATPEMKTISSEKTEVVPQKVEAKPTLPEEAKKETTEIKDVDKTVRVSVAPSKKEEGTKEGVKKVKSKSRIKFILTLLIFGIIAISGIFYFFSGDMGIGDVALMAARGGKPATSIEEPILPPKAAGEQTNIQQTPTAAPSVKTSENVKKSIEIVKNYTLSDGRGTINSWFANNFGSSQQVSDEWTATFLQENTYVVQYRVIRPKQEPLVYQFEVDIEKESITRGINNNAIELLESLKKVNQVQQLPKPKKKPIAKAKPIIKSKEVPLLPLPEREESDVINEPTGLENAETIVTGKVKINAPESDEELF